MKFLFNTREKREKLLEEQSENQEKLSLPENETKESSVDIPNELLAETLLFPESDSGVVKESIQCQENKPLMNSYPEESGKVEENFISGPIPEIPTLSDNKPFTQLVEELVDIINEFEGYSSRLEQEEARMMVNLFTNRLCEMLERSGLELIDSDQTFSILRHIPQPMAMVREGNPLKQILRPGLSLGNRVFRKAVVEIQTNKNE